MIHYARTLSILAAAAIAVFTGALPSAQAQQLGGHGHVDGGQGGSATTSLSIQNQTRRGVYAVITTNTGGLTPSINNIQVNGSSNWVAPSGPPPPVDSGLYYTCPPSNGSCPGTPIQGFFYMRKGTSVQITSTAGQNVLSGVSIAFLQPPYACPGSSNGFYPFVGEFTAANGTNFAEVTLNVTTGENVDISCNNGANAKINMASTGGPTWTNNAGKPVPSFSITNSWVNGTTGQDNNCGVAGVFPYQYTQCTAGPNACPNSPANISCPISTANNGPCQYARTAGKSGGTVTVTFMGPEHPPSPSH
ncbi:hypothetical protein BH10CYA1_BH10CYA1_54060 [soil metagenome]